MPPRKSPQDVTGARAAKLATENADKQAQAAQRMAMMTAANKQAKAETVDLTGHAQAGQTDVDQVELRSGVEVAEAARTIRVNADITQMTFGRGTYYDFEEGRTYRVPADLADHLDALGYVWH